MTGLFRDIFQKTQSRREKFDHIFSARLAAVAVYPQVTLRVRYDLFASQIAHVFVADSRKTGKEKQVAVVVVFGTLQSRRLKSRSSSSLRKVLGSIGAE